MYCIKDGPVSLQPLLNMTSSVSFVAVKRGSQNAVVDGCRYTKNSSHKERVYYRCVEQTTCKARITLTGGALSTPLPQHTHPSQEVDVAVLKVKNKIKATAATTDVPTKHIVNADSLSPLDFEGVSKLNCQLRALSKMSRLSRRKPNRTPPSPLPWRTYVFLPATWRVIRTRAFYFGTLDIQRNADDLLCLDL